MNSSLGNRETTRILCDYDVIVSDSIKGRTIDLSTKSLKGIFREPVEILTAYTLCIKCPEGDAVVDSHSLSIEQNEHGDYIVVFVFEDNISSSGFKILEKCIHSC